MPRKLTTEEFIAKAKEVYSDRFDYSKVNYINSKTDVVIGCQKHGFFTIRANDFLTGYHNCQKCGLENKSKKLSSKKLSKEELKNKYIKEANKKYNYKYDYSKVIYTTKKNKVCIICPEHGEFYQSFDTHLLKGCSKCANNHKFTTEDFVREAKLIHGDLYDYSYVDYKNIKTNVKIKCNKCGNYFYQNWTTHIILGYGCCSCYGVKSKGEEKIENFLLAKNIKSKREFKFNNCKFKRELPFDFYLPDYNTVIEFQGEQHYKPIRFSNITLEEVKIKFNQYQIRDQIKRDFCKSNGIKEIEIKYNDNIEEKLGVLWK